VTAFYLAKSGRKPLVLERRPIVGGCATSEEFAPGYRAWVMSDRSEPGHIGNPSAATAEKGEALFRHFAAGVAAYLERVVAWNGKEWDA